MRVLSVNIGKSEVIPGDAKERFTGIFKRPVSGSVNVSFDGIEGDTICDAKNHGGADQAVYVYGLPDYDWWAARLQGELPPGTFGENLTISDLESAALNIGDRFHIGDEQPVVLEVTAPRIPCATLARRMGSRSFAEKFRDAERPGLYCRVIRPGQIRRSDPVGIERASKVTVSVLEVFRDFYDPMLTAAAIRRFLSAPIAERARRHKERQLESLLAAGSMFGKDV
jgi:MOSC domain-containing protein YiiM